MVFIAQRAESHRLLLTYDPRTEAERLTALKILQLAKFDRLHKADVSDMYRNALNKNSIWNLGKNLNHFKKLLVKQKSNKQIRLESDINKEKKNKEAWKKSFVPSYFESDWGKNFLQNLSSTSNKENQQFLQQSETDFVQQTQTSMAQTQRDEPPRDEPGKQNRKYLPPISYHQETEYSNDKKEILNSTSNFERYQPQFKFQNKLDPKKLPNSIKTTRPNAVPNALFLTNEEPVRRKVKTSIVQAAQLNGKSLERRRGCEVYPKEIKFGILREGFTYVTEFEIVNVGIDACRFKIKQPPPETGLKVLYKPGPIAAGMSVDLSIMLLAMYKATEDTEAEQVSPKLRKLKHNLEITTETDIIRIPIEAEIASIEEFRNMFRGNLEAGKEKNIRILSVRPGSTREVLTKPVNTQSSTRSQDFKLSESGEN